ncbi:MAG: phosphate signaling complex PhoU family protein [Streptosporangiaceae bacterium]
MPELRQGFQRELDVIDAMVIELLSLVASDVPRATYALLSGDNEGLKLLGEHELVVGLSCPEIKRLAEKAVLLQAPVASDLRFLLTVLRVVPELERCHYLVAQIASRANRIRSDGLAPRSRGLVERMGNVASEMWRQAADSWYQHGYSAAALLTERDDGMGELHASLMAELAIGRMTLPITIEMTLVAHFYERLGDHAASIIRQTVYLEGF